MSDIDKLLDAMDVYQRQRDELRACVKGCYEDADYFCHDEYKATEQAKKVLEVEFENYVRSIVFRFQPAIDGSEG